MVGWIPNWRGSTRISSSSKIRADKDGKWFIYTGVEDFHSRTDVTHVRVAPNVTVIRDGAFHGCTNLKTVDLSNATAIGAKAFLHCASLERITVPSVVGEIGAEAFAYCTKLKKVDIPRRGMLLIIRERAFERCVSLKCIIIPGTVVEIGPRAFWFCNKLKKVQLNDGLQMIHYGAFCHCVSLSRIAIPSTVAVICKWAFSNCFKLKQVDLSNAVSIGEGAFRCCISLKHLVIPITVTAIGDEVSSHHVHLKKSDLGSTITIGENAFLKCTSLERISVPSTVTAIDSYAFRGCTKLQDVDLCLDEGSVIEIGNGAFEDCRSLFNLRVPSTSHVIAPQHFGGGLLRSESSRIPPSLGQMTIIVSSFLTENGINKVLHGRGLMWREKLDQIRGLCRLIDATTILELAIWKANIYKDKGQDNSDFRQTCREIHGADMNIIINGVLPFLNASFREE